MNSGPLTRASAILSAPVLSVSLLLLHLLGRDHKRLTYRCAGRDLRLTDVHGHAGKQIVA